MRVEKKETFSKPMKYFLQRPEEMRIHIKFLSVEENRYPRDKSNKDFLVRSFKMNCLYVLFHVSKKKIKIYLLDIHYQLYIQHSTVFIMQTKLSMLTPFKV